MPQSRPKQLAAEVERWNSAHLVGCAVTVELDSGEIVTTRTSSCAHIRAEGYVPSDIAPGSPVIYLTGFKDAFLLSRVRAKGEVKPGA